MIFIGVILAGLLAWGTWSKVGQSRVCLSFAQPVSPSGVKFRIEFKAFACADSPVALSITVGNAILFAVKLQDSELHTEMFIVPAFLIDYTRSLVLTFVTSGGGSVLSRMLERFGDLPEGYFERLEGLEQLRILENGYMRN